MQTSCSAAAAVEYISEGDCFEEQYSSQSATFKLFVKISLVCMDMNIYIYCFICLAIQINFSCSSNSQNWYPSSKFKSHLLSDILILTIPWDPKSRSPLLNSSISKCFLISLLSQALFSGEKKKFKVPWGLKERKFKSNWAQIKPCFTEEVALEITL